MTENNNNKVVYINEEMLELTAQRRTEAVRHDEVVSLLSNISNRLEDQNHLTHESFLLLQDMGENSTIMVKGSWLTRLIQRVAFPVIVAFAAWSGGYLYVNHYDAISNEITANGVSTVAYRLTHKVDDLLVEHAAPKLDIAVENLVGASFEPHYEKVIPAEKTALNSTVKPTSGDITKLSADAESKGSWGIVGYDTGGGYSYGKYQIATKVGTHAIFMRWLSRHDSKSYHVLTKAGGNRGAMSGTKAYRKAWKALSKGKRFRQSQYGFIWKTHYLVYVKNNKSATGLDISKRSFALQSLAFSMAVQHGGNNNLFSCTINKVCYKNGKEKKGLGLGLGATDKALINGVFKIRYARTTGHLTKAEKKGVADRYKRERKALLKLL